VRHPVSSVSSRADVRAAREETDRVLRADAIVEALLERRYDLGGRSAKDRRRCSSSTSALRSCNTGHVRAAVDDNSIELM
jgi:hypothetical protein